MKIESLDYYACPLSKRRLLFNNHVQDNADISEGTLCGDTGLLFRLNEGIPDFTYPVELSTQEKDARNFYDSRSDDYDKYLYLLFKTFDENEIAVREKMIDLLLLKPESSVLEVCAGTGRDTELIANRLSHQGRLFVQDLSPLMLQRCVEKMTRFGDKNIEFSVGNACYLPYQDHVFDATYSFGGLGEVSDIKKAIAEMCRVTKKGGKVVFGDEGIPCWLRDTLFAKILINHNPQFSAKLPLKQLPIDARDVCVRWVIGGTFYLIEFTVGEGEPNSNFNFEIPGARGGTHLTRYYGKLEAVTPETKELAYLAREKLGVSMHQWLDTIIKQAAEKVLKGK